MLDTRHAHVARRPAGETRCLLTELLPPQPLTARCKQIDGPSQNLICNDQGWEGHVIEAPFPYRRGNLCYLFYSGNDYGALLPSAPGCMQASAALLSLCVSRLPCIRGLLRDCS